jgi:hypothetical protein
MPAIVSCPSCSRQLQVPDQLQGKSVRCPSCESVFTALVTPAQAPPLPPSGSAADDFEKVRRDPVGPPPRKEGDRFDSRDRWEDDDEFSRPRRFGDRFRRADNAEAVTAVTGPATALLVSGWLAIAVNVLGLCAVAVQLGLGAGAAAGGAGAKNQNAPIDVFVGGAVAIPIRILGLVLASLVIVGAGRMKRLESHGWAMAASIIAMVPCTGCCILGLPFGIWSLVVLNKPEVKDAFRHVT